MINYSPDWSRVIKCSSRYRAVFCPAHPKAWKKGYVLVHRVVAETAIGRLLTDEEVVHHKDGNTLNNSPENLEVMPRGEHSKIHAREETIMTLSCCECGLEFERSLSQRAQNKGYTNWFCSRRCSGIFNRRQQLNQSHA